MEAARTASSNIQLADLLSFSNPTFEIVIVLHSTFSWVTSMNFQSQLTLEVQKRNMSIPTQVHITVSLRYCLFQMLRKFLWIFLKKMRLVELWVWPWFPTNKEHFRCTGTISDLTTYNAWRVQVHLFKKCFRPRKCLLFSTT
jgi:hypothetical protein